VQSAAAITDEPLSSDHDEKQVELLDSHLCMCSGKVYTVHTIGQEALQMQRDHTMCHKYKILHLKRLAIGE